jgi:hypothetical protein
MVLSYNTSPPVKDLETDFIREDECVCITTLASIKIQKKKKKQKTKTKTKNKEEEERKLSNAHTGQYCNGQSSRVLLNARVPIYTLDLSWMFPYTTCET